MTTKSSKLTEHSLAELCGTVDMDGDMYSEPLLAMQTLRVDLKGQTDPLELLRWMQTQLSRAGAVTTEMWEVEVPQAMPPVPPVLTATIPSTNPKATETILLYGHMKRDKIGQNVFGRGLEDVRGSLVCWTNALLLLKRLGIGVAVNIKFIIETMPADVGVYLKRFLEKKLVSFLRDVTVVCMADGNPEMDPNTPTVVSSFRGYCRFELSVKCANEDLHSGTHGGVVAEAMTDVIHLLSSLVDSKGKITVPDLKDEVAEPSYAEEQYYHSVLPLFNVESYKSRIGAKKLLHKEDLRVTMHRTRFPSLTVHSVRSVGDDTDRENEGHRTFIPHKVVGTFSLRTVPNQKLGHVIDCVNRHLNNVFETLGSGNEIKLETTAATKHWTVDTENAYFKALTRAVGRTYRRDVRAVRNGGTVPSVSDLSDLTGKPVLLIPTGGGPPLSGDQLTERYRQAVKTVIHLVFEIGSLK